MDKLDQGSSRTFEAPPPPQPRAAAPAATNNPILPVLAYCGSSILMTVMNKYVLSGTNFNLNFFLLCVQVRVESMMEWCALFTGYAWLTEHLVPRVYFCDSGV